MSNYVFDVAPMAKPRMTQRDKWKKRDCVQRYYCYKDLLVSQANEMGFPEDFESLSMEFYLPIPKSWSIKKTNELNGTLHKGKPDIDNLVKGFLDPLLEDDSKVSRMSAIKYWSDTPRIVVSFL